MIAYQTEATAAETGINTARRELHEQWSDGTKYVTGEPMRLSESILQHMNRLVWLVGETHAQATRTDALLADITKIDGDVGNAEAEISDAVRDIGTHAQTADMARNQIQVSAEGAESAWTALVTDCEAQLQSAIFSMEAHTRRLSTNKTDGDDLLRTIANAYGPTYYAGYENADKKDALRASVDALCTDLRAVHPEEDATTVCVRGGDRGRPRWGRRNETRKFRGREIGLAGTFARGGRRSQCARNRDAGARGVRRRDARGYPAGKDSNRRG